MSRLPVSLGVLGTLVLAACAAPAPTPIPAVTVHVRNLISNVVVSSIELHPDGVLGTPPTDGFGFIEPCGGEVEIEAPIDEHSGAGGLGLSMDPEGDLDRFYPDGIVEPSDVYGLGLAIMWTENNLQEGDWVTITPDEVVVGREPGSLPSDGTCAPWSYTGQ